jgi:hypothetical protein
MSERIEVAIDQYEALSEALLTERPVEIWFWVDASWLWVDARLETAFIAEEFVRMLLPVIVYVPVIVGWKQLGTFRTGTGTIGRHDAFGRGSVARWCPTFRKRKI